MRRWRWENSLVMVNKSVEQIHVNDPLAEDHMEPNHCCSVEENGRFPPGVDSGGPIKHPLGVCRSI